MGLEGEIQMFGVRQPCGMNEVEEMERMKGYEGKKGRKENGIGQAGK